MDTRSIREAIESTSKRSIPGLLELIDLYCRLKFKSDYVNVLFNNPEYVVDFLKTLYTPEVVESIIRELFIKPIVSVLGVSDFKRLVELAIREPIVFKEELKRLLETKKAIHD